MAFFEVKTKKAFGRKCLKAKELDRMGPEGFEPSTNGL